MQRFIIAYLSLLLICGFWAKPAAADDWAGAAPVVALVAAPDSAAAGGVGSSQKQVPETLLEFGIEERVRVEDYDNTGEFLRSKEDVQQRTRFRTKMWTRWTPTASVEFYLRLGNEFKKTTDPGLKWECNAPDEGFIDNLYIDFKQLIVPGLSLKVGRQDLVKGEGFLLTEYTAGDGSRSIYMNGFDLAYSVRKSSLHLLGVAATRKDHYLPRINDADRYTNESDNSMLGLYYETRRRTTDVDAYWLYSSEVRDYRDHGSAAYIPDRHHSTIGGRVLHKLSKTASIAGEFAYQVGSQHANAARLMPESDVRAWGGYASAKKEFDRSWKPFVQVAEYFYSGDENETDGRATGFDPVFGRWPGRSELLAYGLQKEKGFAYYSNMRLTSVQAGMSPLKQLKTSASYQRVDAFHPNTSGSSEIFANGTHRGDLFGVKGEVTLNDNWKGHVLYEAMLPGNFYAGDDFAHFFRVEVMYTFKKALLKH
jgi:hypothetical protein